MNIVICGAGQVGSSLAKYLSDRGNSVTLIDTNRTLIDSINQKLDVKAVCGQAAHPDVLKSVNLEKADILIAVTHIDEVNMVTCEVAHALFQIPKKIARIRSKSYLKLRGTGFFTDNNLSIDYVISPEGEVAHALTRKFAFPGILDDIPFINGMVHLIRIKCNKDRILSNISIKEVYNLLDTIPAKIVTILRNKQIINLSNDLKLLPNDEIFIIVQKKHIHEILVVLGYREDSAKSLIIIGGGNIGLFLAQEIETYYPEIELRIIEKDIDRANNIAQQLNRAIVIKGDALDKEVLQEAGIKHDNIVVSVTADEKVNTLSSVLAKRLGNNKTLCLSNDSSFADLALSLGADGVINPKEVTISKIMQYIQKEQINSLYSLGEGIGEVFDVNADHTNKLIGKSINDIASNMYINVITIMRDQEVFVPKDDETIKTSDRLLLLVHTEHIQKAYNIIGIE